MSISGSSTVVSIAANSRSAASVLLLEAAEVLLVSEKEEVEPLCGEALLSTAVIVEMAIALSA